MREEQHYIRDVRFSQWIRRECPQRQYSVSDIDFVIMNWREKRFALIEYKCRRASMPDSQRTLLHRISNMLTMGLHIYPGWVYAGLWLIQFENETPYDGRIWMDGIEVTEAELKHHMSTVTHPSNGGVGTSENHMQALNHPPQSHTHTAG
jgi:hypothetical protein